MKTTLKNRLELLETIIEITKTKEHDALALWLNELVVSHIEKLPFDIPFEYQEVVPKCISKEHPKYMAQRIAIKSHAHSKIATNILEYRAYATIMHLCGIIKGQNNAAYAIIQLYKIIANVQTIEAANEFIDQTILSLHAIS